jgi:hypothetical protein
MYNHISYNLRRGRRPILFNIILEAINISYDRVFAQTLLKYSLFLSFSNSDNLLVT